LLGAAKSVQDELLGIPDLGDLDDTPFAREYAQVEKFKKSILLVAGAATQKLMGGLAKEQEILMNIADMAIDTYVAESLLLRVHKRINTLGEDDQKVYGAMAKLFIHDASGRIGKCAKEAVLAFGEGDELRMMLMGIKRFTKTETINPTEMRRRIAQRLIDENKFAL